MRREGSFRECRVHETTQEGEGGGGGGGGRDLEARQAVPIGVRAERYLGGADINPGTTYT